MTDHPSLEEINATAQRIAPYIATTPVLPYYGSEGFANGADVYLKMELLQKTGSFKPRGAINAVSYTHLTLPTIYSV